MAKKLGSKRWYLNREDAEHIGKVFLWSLLSAMIAAVIGVVSNSNVPPEYAFAVPLVNSLLVALKRWSDDRTRS